MTSPLLRRGLAHNARPCGACVSARAGVHRPPFSQVAMPKQKSHSGAKKRFRFTASGKAKRKFSHKNHILTKKNADRVRKLRGTTIVSEPDQKRVERMLPHGR